MAEPASVGPQETIDAYVEESVRSEVPADYMLAMGRVKKAHGSSTLEARWQVDEYAKKRPGVFLLHRPAQPAGQLFWVSLNIVLAGVFVWWTWQDWQRTGGIAYLKVAAAVLLLLLARGQFRYFLFLRSKSPPLGDRC